MILRLLLTLSISIITIFQLLAQTSTVSGTSIDIDSNKTVQQANVVLQGKVNYESTTDATGKFSLKNVVYGDYILKLTRPGYDEYTATVKVNSENTALGLIIISQVDINAERLVQDNIPTVSLAESDLRDQSSQNVSGVLSASRDPFISAASFNWGQMRFRVRGYDYENITTLMNGVPMNDLATGQTLWGSWGGLNDVMRNRENLIGIVASTFTYGGIGGSNDLDVRASRQRKGITASYAVANRSYDHRLMATYNSGILKGGWAYSLSASRRWAKEGYVPGTFFDGYSYFASVEKLFGYKHSLSLTTFAAPTRNGRTSAAVQEMYDIAGTNYYNPNWGFQNGEKRNASVAKNFQPVFILNHEWKINENANLETGVSYMFGKNALGRLDWFNAPDPRPDFYRRLPSLIEDSTLSAQAREELTNNEAARQINWDNLYQTNRNNIETVANGNAGDSITGKRSLYVLQDWVTDNQKFNFNTVFNQTLGDHIALTAGVTYQYQKSRFYQEITDLLGGDFFVDLNQFAEREFPNNNNAAQNDLNNPNRIVRVGDQYGYDYFLNIRKGSGWLQSQFKFNHFDFFVAGEIAQTNFWRDGNTQVGLFPNTSLGESEKQKFFNYSVKGGATYKINGRNYAYASAAYFTRPPAINDVLVSPRTRNQFADNITPTQVYSAEGGYVIRSPNFKGRATAFFAQNNNQIQSLIFYHEDFRTFGNYVLTNVDIRNVGIELTADVKIYKGFSAQFNASIGQYYYTDRMLATATRDNDEEILANETIYSKDFRVGGIPQQAYNLGLSYRGKKFWFVNVNLNVFHKTFVSFNPSRRTSRAVDLVEEGSPDWNEILEQEEVNTKFSEKYTLDVFAGKSWKLTKERIKDKYNIFMVLNVGVNNITNNRNIITNGFEQLRFDSQTRNPDKFATRYFYNPGTTFFVSLAFRLN